MSILALLKKYVVVNGPMRIDQDSMEDARLCALRGSRHPPNHDACVYDRDGALVARYKYGLKEQLCGPH